MEDYSDWLSEEPEDATDQLFEKKEVSAPQEDRRPAGTGSKPRRPKRRRRKKPSAARYWLFNSVPVALVCALMGCGMLYFAWSAAHALSELPTEDWDMAREAAQRKANRLAKQNPGQLATVTYKPSPMVGGFVEMFGAFGVFIAGMAGLGCFALGWLILIGAHDNSGTDPPLGMKPLSEGSETTF